MPSNNGSRTRKAKSTFEVFKTAQAQAEADGIPQPEGFSVPVTIRVVMWPTNAAYGEYGDRWKPTPREVAEAIEEHLKDFDLRTGWTIQAVTGGV